MPIMLYDQKPYRFVGIKLCVLSRSNILVHMCMYACMLAVFRLLLRVMWAVPAVVSGLQHVMAAHLISCGHPVYSDEYLSHLDSSCKCQVKRDEDVGQHCSCSALLCPLRDL